MQSFPALRAGTLALACVLAPVTLAAAADLLTGIPRLACEATLCLSSGLRPNECSPSLDHYFDIKKYNKHGLDWSATVAARRSFLSQCPASTDQGMPERIDAISRGAGKCEAEYLNRTYAAKAYKWRKREYGGDSGETVYEVHPLPTVTLDQLPAYCVVYNDHAWTHELSVRYVGRPAIGGRWVKVQEYEAAQAKWDADHNGLWASGWNFSLMDPRHRVDH
ncbi:TrbM/KikA/MpfK family conjugal transfer protein [Allopusillimonas ginsengisoli]|uniref:TrbM/KikA/MpfK family conjugal transfer protein n=1 Tax=Allopusillimonas ginsengisoli TaxID=453575 RepID=UPI0039C39A74